MATKNPMVLSKNEIEELYNRYADMVYRLAFARVKNRYDADDILQEVFLRYLRAKEHPREEEHQKALFIRITLNCTKSFFTTAAARHNVPLRDDLSEQPKNGETIDAVLRLPKKYRTVIHLHYYCGYSVEEIGVLTGSHPSTVKSQLHRAREKLRAQLKGEAF